jgi:hypothetical protein
VERLDGPANSKELHRLTLKSDLGDRVHVPSLGRTADGLGSVKTGRAEHGDASFGKLLEGAFDLAERISLVRAKTQERKNHQRGL